MKRNQKIYKGMPLIGWGQKKTYLVQVLHEWKEGRGKLLNVQSPESFFILLAIILVILGVAIGNIFKADSIREWAFRTVGDLIYFSSFPLYVVLGLPISYLLWLIVKVMVTGYPIKEKGADGVMILLIWFMLCSTVYYLLGEMPYFGDYITNLRDKEN